MLMLSKGWLQCLQLVKCIWLLKRFVTELGKSTAETDLPHLSGITCNALKMQSAPFADLANSYPVNCGTLQLILQQAETGMTGIQTSSTTPPPLPPESGAIFDQLRLLRSRRVGVATFRRLLSEHGTAARALMAKTGELVEKEFQEREALRVKEK